MDCLDQFWLLSIVDLSALSKHFFIDAIVLSVDSEVASKIIQTVWQLFIGCQYINLWPNDCTLSDLLQWIMDNVAIVPVGNINPPSTVKPVCNDHLYNKINYLWFSQ